MRALFLLLFCLATAASAAERPVMALLDAVGDDTGDGTLLYPTEGTLQPGDLDMRALSISRDDKGYWFTATFANFIHENWWSPKGDDAGFYSKLGQHRLSFSFNLDLYIDTDRKNGSGNLFTLPGRKVRIDKRYAWERAVLLSPRPRAMRDRLLDKLRETFPGRPEAEAEASIDANMYFAGSRRIADRSVTFFVPAAFMGDSNPSAWAITAFVTMAAPVVDSVDLGVLPVTREASAASLGHTGPTPPPPIVDLLLPTAARQYRVLSSAEALPGVTEGMTAEDDARPAYEGDRFKARLQALKDLLDRKLIDEAAYKVQRRRILEEL